MEKDIIQESGQRIASSVIPINAPNTVYHNTKDIFYLSYNRHSSDYGCPTTAVVICEPSHCEVYFVLNGNHTKQLKDLDLIDTMTYVLENYDKINELGKEGKEFYEKGLTNIKNGHSYFLDNEDKWTLFCDKHHKSTI